MEFSNITRKCIRESTSQWFQRNFLINAIKLADRSRSKKPSQKVFPFRNLLKCEECGCTITSETQKEHNYYRYTKKKIPCSQKYVREENLAEQISKILQKVSLPSNWAKNIISELDKEKEESAQTGAVFAQNLKEQIKECEKKLDLFWTRIWTERLPKMNMPPKNRKFSTRKLKFPKNFERFWAKQQSLARTDKKVHLEANQAQIVAEKGDPKEKAEFLKKSTRTLF